MSRTDKYWLIGRPHRVSICAMFINWYPRNGLGRKHLDCINESHINQSGDFTVTSFMLTPSGFFLPVDKNKE